MYCTKDDVIDVYGAVNVSAWADIDNDKNSAKIDARIDRAIQWACDEIDSFLLNSIYQTPVSSADDTVPADIRNLAATLAGVWLYESRGVVDFSPETGQVVHKLQWQRRRVYDTLRSILAGQRALKAKTKADCYPKGVK